MSSDSVRRALSVVVGESSNERITFLENQVKTLTREVEWRSEELKNLGYRKEIVWCDGCGFTDGVLGADWVAMVSRLELRGWQNVFLIIDAAGSQYHGICPTCTKGI